jgi:arylsulfatase A-like enzyme
VNLLPHLTGEKTGAPHEAIYLRMHDRGAFTVRAGESKLVILSRDEPPKLFNLRRDVAESRDLAPERPDELARLERLRATWNAQLVPPAFEGLQTAPRPAEKAKR